MKIALILIGIAAAGLAACGDDGGSAGGGPTVVATTGVMAAIVGEVAGDDAKVVQLIPDSASPHDFALSARDRLELEEADLVVANGQGLEAGVPLDGVPASVWVLTEHVGPLLETSGDNSKDPHVWMDPTRTARAIPSLAEALGEADPEDASSYEERGRELAGRLRALDRELAMLLERIPSAARLLVTNHDALGYFADRYEYEIVATAFPTSGPEAEASASDIANLEATVRETGVPAVFAEESENPATLRRVGDDVGVEVVADLLVESPGEAGSYEEMLRRDARLVSNALKR